jgi:hypothetical protein
MPKPSEIVSAINGLLGECDTLRRRIEEKETVRGWEYRVVIARKPREPDGVWLPATYVLGAPGAPGAPGHFLGEVQPPLFEVVEVPAVRKAKDVLGALKLDIGIEPIEDIFNDKVNYSECWVVRQRGYVAAFRSVWSFTLSSVRPRPSLLTQQSARHSTTCAASSMACGRSSPSLHSSASRTM